MEKICQLYEENSSLYLEQELSEDQSRQFERHLKSCQQCQARISQLRLLMNSLRATSSIQPSKDFETILRTRIQMTKRIGRSSWSSFSDRFKVPAYAVAMTAAIASIFFFNSRTPTQKDYFSMIPTENIQKSSIEADIQPGDVVYGVDILMLPEESQLFKVPAKQKSSIMRSMIIARGQSQSDSIAKSISIKGSFSEEGTAVSF